MIEVSTAEQLRTAAAGEFVSPDRVVGPGATIEVVDDIDLGDSSVEVEVEDVTITAADDEEVFAESGSFPGSDDRGLIEVFAEGVTIEDIDLALRGDVAGEQDGIPVVNVEAADATLEGVTAERDADEPGPFTQVVRIAEDASGATVTDSEVLGSGEALNAGLTDAAGDVTVEETEFASDADVAVTLAGDGATLDDNEFEADEETLVYVFDFEGNTNLGDLADDQEAFDPPAVVEGVDFETGGVSIEGDALVPE